MTKQSKGRVGVAPSRECCPVCGDRATLHQTRDDEERGPGAMPDGLQDALYRYAVLRSTSN